jgi:hypothetical protein
MTQREKDSMVAIKHFIDAFHNCKWALLKADYDMTEIDKAVGLGEVALRQYKGEIADNIDKSVALSEVNHRFLQ